MNYFQKALQDSCKITYLIDYTVMPDIFLKITFNIVGTFCLEIDNMGLHNATQLACSNMKAIKKIYGKKFLFTMPELSFTPNENLFSLKVGLMEKSRYKEICWKKLCKERQSND